MDVMGLNILGSDVCIENISGQQGISAFDAQYLVDPDVDDTLMQEIIDWLAVNCRDNFVVTARITRLVAGGYSNNRDAAERGLFDLNSKKCCHGFEDSTEYIISLSRHDDALFSLAWLDRSKG